MDWQFESTTPVNANVRLSAGEVEVSLRPDTAVNVTLESMGRHPERDAEAIAHAKVTLDGGTLRVELPDRISKRTEIRALIGLPIGSSLSAATASAGVRSTDGLASCDVATASGDVTLGDVTGDVSVKTASGDLGCASVGGRLKLAGASSDVNVRRVAGEVDVKVASGDVAIGSAGSSVKLRSASGDLQVAEAKSGDVVLETVSGDVVVGVAAGVGAELDVTTVSGTPLCTLPFSEAGGRTDLHIRCRTVSGDVHVQSAAAAG